ncbi:L-2-hydroxyglutarate dehydrogenase, mitochondrial [Aphelenchoides fujianensis]|nr:L-2-hydroxyglutarate dehydrogenase, mitochondrial [Aphelenchoides fujianensis]
MSTAAHNFDAVIVGGGIVGCATARQLKTARPELRVALIEKENELAVHQTGRNSGVLHAGIYYAPGSLKARLCVEGIDLAYEYLDKKRIPCGKLIVALDESEIDKLHTLYGRAQQNGCKEIELVGVDKIREIQPHCRGIKAIWSPYTGIVDWALVCRSYAEDFEQAGAAECSPAIRWWASRSPPIPTSRFPELSAKFVITRIGVAQLTGCSAAPKILPFRGEYLYLKPEKHHLHLPRSGPALPFLGVHFTPTMRNEVSFWGRTPCSPSNERATRTSTSRRATSSMRITYPGMLRLMGKYTRFGAEEMYRGIFFGSQVKLLQRYIPEITRADVTRGRAGVRAQALDPSGQLVDDFVFDDGIGPLAPKLLHIRNAPSPGATSSLAIAKMVVEKAVEKFHL